MAYNKFDLQNEITYLKGVGPRKAELLNKIGIFTFYDFLTHYPRDYEDAREITPINALEVDEVAIIVGIIDNVDSRQVRNNLTIINATVEDDTGYVRATWFNQEYLMNRLYPGTRILIKGKVGEAYGYRNMYSISVQSFDILGRFEEPNLGIFPIYPSTAKLNQTFFRTSMRILIDNLPKLQEILPESIIEEHNLISYDKAMRSIHFPESRLDIDEARNRLAFNELFLIQYGLMLLKKQTQEEELGIKHKRNGTLFKSVFESLPFDLPHHYQ